MDGECAFERPPIAELERDLSRERLVAFDSRFNLLGTYNDDPTGASAVHTRHVASGQGSYGEFKVVP